MGISSGSNPKIPGLVGHLPRILFRWSFVPLKLEVVLSTEDVSLLGQS